MGCEIEEEKRRDERTIGSLEKASLTVNERSRFRLLCAERLCQSAFA